jgi:O-antigen ligase
LESNPVNLTYNIVILGSTICLLILNWRRSVPLLARSTLIMAFVTLALASISWSVEPGITLRRIGTMTTAILVAAYMVSRFDVGTCIRIAGYAFVGVIGMSIVVAVAVPSMGIMHGAVGAGAELNGTWKGVLQNKNSLGWITIAGSQVYAWRFIEEPANRRGHAAILALFVFAALMTTSATALISILFTFIVLAALRVRQWPGMGRVFLEWTFLAVLVTVTLALSLDFSGILTAIGKDPTLTGRVPLWASLMDSIAKHPWHGYGYNAFWLKTNPELFRIWALNPWKPPEAHNAYLDMALELGIPGSIFATSILLTVLVRSLRLCRSPNVSWASFIGVYSIIFIVTNMVETRLFRAGDIHCFLLSCCYFAMVQHAYDVKVSNRPQQATRRRLAQFSPDSGPFKPSSAGDAGNRRPPREWLARS